MYARVFRIQASPDRVEEGIRAIEQQSAEVRSMSGFRQGYLLLDRQAGEAMTITLWESEEAMTAAQPRAREILSGALQAIGGQMSEPRQYEVAVEL